MSALNVVGFVGRSTGQTTRRRRRGDDSRHDEKKEGSRPCVPQKKKGGHDSDNDDNRGAGREKVRPPPTAGGIPAIVPPVPAPAPVATTTPEIIRPTGQLVSGGAVNGTSDQPDRLQATMPALGISLSDPRTITVIVVGSLSVASLLLLLFCIFRRRFRRGKPPARGHTEYNWNYPDKKVPVSAFDTNASRAGTSQHNAPRGIDPYDFEDYQRLEPDNKKDEWFARNAGKTAQPSAPSNPRDSKNPMVSEWVDRHSSCTLDPMWAQPSVRASAATGLRSPQLWESVSQMSVAASSILDCYSQPSQAQGGGSAQPPLHDGMVQRVRYMQQSDGSYEGSVGVPSSQVLRVSVPPPAYISNWPAAPGQAGGDGKSPSFNTWGVERHEQSPHARWARGM